MKTRSLLGKILASAAVALALAGCMTTKQARDVESKGYLVNPDMLTKGEGDQALYVYRKPNVNMQSYRKVMIEPVKFFKPAKASPEEVADIQKLASNFNQYLYQELSKNYTIVTLPEAGVLKVETAILSADTSSPTMDFISTLLPIGLGVSLIKDFATGKPLNVGEISGEMKLTDAATGELFAAAADKRVGGKSFSGMFTSWDDANHAMEYWAKKLGYFMCMERGGTSCEKPSNY